MVVAQTPQLGPGHLLYAIEGNFYNGPWDHPQLFRKVSGLLKYTLERGPSTFTLGATAYYAKWHSSDQVPQRAVDQGLIARLGTIDPSDGGITSRFSLYSAWSYKGEHSLTTANAYMIYCRLNLFSNLTFFLDDPVNEDQIEQADRRVVVGGNVSQTWFTTWLGAAMDHTLGLQVRHDALPEVGLFHTRERIRLNTVRDDTVHETSVGFYYQIDYFYVSRLPGEPAAGMADLHFHPVEPRTVRFSLMYKF